MHTAGCSSVVIIDNDVPIGIWTEADALRVVADPEAPLEPESPSPGPKAVESRD